MIPTRITQMSMKRIAIGHGVYQGEDGSFWARPWVAGRRTWRRLDATKEKLAIAEAASTDFTRKAEKLDKLAAKIAEKKSDPYSAVDEILK